MSSSQQWECSVNAGRLRYDHRSFDARLREFRRLAADEGWRELRQGWNAFTSDVVRHFAFEELSVFPGFARHKPGEAALVGRLIDEHEQLRRMLDRLTTAVSTGDVHTLVLDGFGAAMRRHQELENHRIDPWLEMQDHRGDPR